MKKKLISIVLVMMLCIGIIPTSMLSSNALTATLQDDGNGGYYYNMPNLANVINMDLTDKTDGFTFKVYDDGGAEENYSINSTRTLIINAPADYMIKVSGSGETESGFDYLKIFDGDTSTVLGNNQYDGTFAMDELKTTGNVMKIQFVSNSNTVFSGYDLTVTLVDCSSYPRVTYAYNGSTKTYLVESGTSTQLKTFTSMFTLPERYLFTCWQSGGNNYNEGDSYEVTGDVTFTALVEEEPVILSDGNGGYYSKLPKTGTLTADLSDKDDGFTLKVYDNGGVNKPYSYSCDGYLLVEAPAGKILRVNGSISTYKNYDYMMLYDGDTSTQIGPKFEGYAQTVDDYFTSGNVLKIYFYSYYGNNYSGLDLNVTVTDPDDVATATFSAGDGSGTMSSITVTKGNEITIPECTFTAPEGKIFSHYLQGSNRFDVGDTVVLDADLSMTAVYVDKATITYSYNGATKSFDYIKGSYVELSAFNKNFTLPDRHTFEGWKVHGTDDVFNAGTDYLLNGDVTFDAVVTEDPVLVYNNTDGWYATMPKTGTITADLTEKSSGFSFKVYDDGKNGNYSNNCNGYMLINAPSNCVLTVSGSGTTELNYDYLTVYEGETTTVLGDNLYEGNFTMPELMSASNCIKLKFYSDSSQTYSGFELTVTVVSLDSLCTVTYNAGDGSGTMNGRSVASGTEITLPECTFTAPDNKIFSHYTDGSNSYRAGDKLTVNNNVTLTAVYADKIAVTYAFNDSTSVDFVAKGSKINLSSFTSKFTLPSRSHFVCWRYFGGDDTYIEGDEFTVTDTALFRAELEYEPVLTEDGQGGYYVDLPSSGTLTADLNGKNSGFTFKVYDDGGKTYNYLNSSNGKLVVTAPEGYVLSISGSGAIEKNYDYLYINDGSANHSYTGLNVTIDELTTVGNTLEISFTSDSSVDKGGFELTVTLIAVADIIPVHYAYGADTETVNVTKDTVIKLAEFSDFFNLPATDAFVCWQINDTNYDAGDDYTVTEEVTFTAVTEVMPTVTFDGGGAAVIGGNGETITEAISFPTGTTSPLPHANQIFNIPDNKYFEGWSYNNRVYNVGEEFTLTENVTFTAVWRDANAWDQLYETLNNAASGTDLGTITLTQNLTGESGSFPLTVPEGVTATVDLAGYTIDGSATAAVTGGNVFVVYGNLTVADSSNGENGEITGGNITTIESGVLTINDALSDSFEATVTQSYVFEDNDTNVRTENTFSVTYCRTLADAMEEASYGHSYRNEITTLPADENSYYFWYNDSKVALLKDMTIARGETLEVNSNESIWFDLNGHTIDIQGTFTGGIEGTQYQDGQYIPTFYPTNVQVVSTTAGTFRSSGTIGVNLQPWTEDTYYFTGGTISGFLGADGGNFHISGGHFTEIVMFNNGNEDAALEIDISGNAEFDRLEHMIYSDPDYKQIHMTIGGKARVRNMLFEIMGADEVNYPVLTVNGGYFSNDPRIWRGGYLPVDPDDVDSNNLSQYYVYLYGTYTAYDDLTEYQKENFTDYYIYSDTYYEDVVQISGITEQYNGQPGWSADSDIYTWRVKPANPNEKTIVYTYNVYDEATGQPVSKNIPKTVDGEGKTTEQLVELNKPYIQNPYYTYGNCEYTESGSTINVTIPHTEKKYTVTLDGNEVGEYGYLETATVNVDEEKSFVVDGKVVCVGSSYSFYVGSDTDITTDAPTANAEYTLINLNSITVTDEKVELDMLATANVGEGKFQRMGVAFALSEKTEDEIAAAVQNVTTGTATSNKIAVHNSSVNMRNKSGQYQFRYAPYFARDKAKDATIYFYTYVVTDDGIKVSDVAQYNMRNLLA